MCTRTTIKQKLPHLYEESDALSENSCEDDFNGSDDEFLVLYDE
jgi:hypothetical protein